MNRLRVIVSSHNTLAALGLRKILSDVFDIDALIVDGNYFDTSSPASEPDFFFIDRDTFIGKLTFFLPRKPKTILLIDDGQEIGEFNSLNTASSESELIDSLNHIIQVYKQDNSTSTTLSSREIEVLRLVASGKINKEIAQQLNISINTVLTHRKNITAKLGIKSVSGLSFYAMMNGII